ncbi:hypothetical protein [Rhizobium leguminosarum]|uniref:hypothetical protein n=1 Tax=Rhizobium leguminosarum TaxID=384 RepID=UPI001C939413|nr:hypothetical protein [Rhizobium leguminosarum]MBY5415359.1 hypothetical protein [Rhizobium leguminosarum]
MLSQTPIGTEQSTDLGAAFSKHLKEYHFNDRFAVGTIDTGWLDAIRNRSNLQNDATLKRLADELLRLLRDPQRIGPDFKTIVEDAFQGARKFAYPLCTRLLAAIHNTASVSRDYTLSNIDLGQVRRMEDEALNDASMRSFVIDMLRHLDNKSGNPFTEVHRQVFDVYSEALVCRLLRERVGPNLKIEKVPESNVAGPDFRCVLHPDGNVNEAIEFYIELKSLDVADASFRLKEMMDEGLEVELDLESQILDGARIAIAEGEIAPNRRIGKDQDYDPRSVRKNIELLAGKACGNFKSKQFTRGPTFALANLLRLNVMPQGLGTLAPVFFDEANGGACISGVLWNVAFGNVGDPIHKPPEFEGEGTFDGQLKCAGLLVDPSLQLDAAGFIVLHWDGGFRFDGFYDARWTHKSAGWSNLQVEEVLYALCEECNNRRNESAYKYSRFRRRGQVM